MADLEHARSMLRMSNRWLPRKVRAMADIEAIPVSALNQYAYFPIERV